MPTYYVPVGSILPYLTRPLPASFLSVSPSISLPQWSCDSDEETLICTDTEQFCITALSPLWHPREIGQKRLGWRAETWFSDARRENEPGEVSLILNVMRVSSPASINYVIPILPRTVAGGIPADMKERIAEQEANEIQATVRKNTLGGKHYRQAVTVLQEKLPGLQIEQFHPGLEPVGGFEGVSMEGTYSTYPFSWKQGGPAQILIIGEWHGTNPMNELFGVIDEPVRNGMLFCTPHIYSSDFLVERLLAQVDSLKQDHPEMRIVFPYRETS